MSPSVSIIAACRNEAAHIAGFIDSALGQDLDGSFEVIVAEGMSDDGTREILDAIARRDSRLKVVSNPGRFTSSGLNAAIATAGGEVIVRMDAHTDYAPDYVRRCLEVLESTGADNVGGPARTRASGWIQRAIAAAYHSPFACGGARFHDENYEGPVDTVTYGCWRRETLERLGLFDEFLVRNQDDELNLRLVRRGGVIWQSPRIVSWYHPRPKLAQLFRQYYQYGFWKVAVIRKHRLPAHWRQLAPATFVATHATLLALSAGAAVAGAAGILSWAPGLWAAAAAVYAAANLLASFATARARGWGLLPVLPLVFAVYHVSYGLGFLRGIGHHCFGDKRGVIAGDLASRISR